MEYVQREQGYAVQMRHIISVNKIQSAGKAHHQMLGKGGTYTLYNNWPDI